MNRYLILLVILLATFSSCQEKRKKPKTLSEIKAYEKPLEEVNKYLLKQDENEIEKYCSRRGWKMKMTESGLWYGALKTTHLDSVRRGDFVELKFSVDLMDGTEIYNSDSMGTKTFEVGHGGVENGLEEGLLLMKNKEKFRFIMPPHKAYGLLGDLNKIPARTTIIYYVEIINLQH